MAKTYLIDCKDAGVECEFISEGASVEEVIEHCAEHGRSEHGMTSFTPEFYTKMRRCIRTVDDAASAPR